jgi:hypothetical protein
VLAAEMPHASADEISAHERAEMAAVSEWLGGGRDGEVVDHEAGFSHEDMTWRRTGADGISRPLW